MKDSMDSRILEGIRNHDTQTIKSLYETCFPQVRNMVVRNGGSENAAKDIFQEAMIIVYRKIIDNKLNLSCRLNTYIYAICKRLLIQEHRSSRYLLNLSSEKADRVNEPDENDDYNKKVFALFDRQFARLSKACQKILTMHFRGKKISEIKKAMKYDNIHHTMDRKYRCKASLIRRIMNDPEFKELQNETEKKSDPLHGRDAGQE
jgi:RNA polymerase sigma factor (sigma-70 family)